jgi:hypothetical protein
MRADIRAGRFPRARLRHWRLGERTFEVFGLTAKVLLRASLATIIHCTLPSVTIELHWRR